MMEKITLSIILFLSFNGLAQNENVLDIDYQQEKYDTITCSDFIQAHRIVQKDGTSKYAQIVDYPVLKYIHDTEECSSLEEHSIDVNELKYFIYTILNHAESRSIL